MNTDPDDAFDTLPMLIDPDWNNRHLVKYVKLKKPGKSNGGGNGYNKERNHDTGLDEINTRCLNRL